MIDDNSPDGTQDVVKRLQDVYGDDRIVSIRLVLHDLHVLYDCRSLQWRGSWRGCSASAMSAAS